MIINHLSQFLWVRNLHRARDLGPQLEDLQAGGWNHLQVPSVTYLAAMLAVIWDLVSRSVGTPTHGLPCGVSALEMLVGLQGQSERERERGRKGFREQNKSRIAFSFWCRNLGVIAPFMTWLWKPFSITAVTSVGKGSYKGLPRLKGSKCHTLI